MPSYLGAFRVIFMKSFYQCVSGPYVPLREVLLHICLIRLQLAEPQFFFLLTNWQRIACPRQLEQNTTFILSTPSLPPLGVGVSFLSPHLFSLWCPCALAVPFQSVSHALWYGTPLAIHVLQGHGWLCCHHPGCQAKPAEPPEQELQQFLISKVRYWLPHNIGPIQACPLRCCWFVWGRSLAVVSICSMKDTA